MKHHKDCNWEKSNCEYKNTHRYCPHQEHLCNCKELVKDKLNRIDKHVTNKEQDNAIREQKYNKLKQIIIKANPEIMELKFGCKLILDEENEYCNLKKGDKVIFTCDMFKPKHIHTGFAESYEIVDIGILDGFKILGRPITLADVLLALKKKARSENGSLVWFDQVYIRQVSYLLEKWDLTKDLDGQSDETKQGLIKLLVK